MRLAGARVLGLLDRLLARELLRLFLATLLGVLALYLLIAVEVTSLLRRRLPKRLWRAVHLSSYVVYLSASVHFLTAGSDAVNIVARVGVVLTGALMAFFVVYLMVGPGKAASVKGGSQPARISRPERELDSTVSR